MMIEKKNPICMDTIFYTDPVHCFISASQLSQSAYYSLQLPFEVFGLGQTPNFVDVLEVGIQNPPNTVSGSHVMCFSVKRTVFVFCWFFVSERERERCFMSEKTSASLPPLFCALKNLLEKTSASLPPFCALKDLLEKNKCFFAAFVLYSSLCVLGCQLI